MTPASRLAIARRCHPPPDGPTPRKEGIATTGRPMPPSAPLSPPYSLPLARLGRCPLPRRPPRSVVAPPAAFAARSGAAPRCGLVHGPCNATRMARAKPSASARLRSPPHAACIRPRLLRRLRDSTDAGLDARPAPFHPSPCSHTACARWPERRLSAQMPSLFYAPLHRPPCSQAARGRRCNRRGLARWHAHC